MKHVIIVNHNAGSPYHGPNFRSYYSALGWLKLGYKTTIVCSSFSHKLKKTPEVVGDYKIEDIDGIRYIWVKTTPYKSNFGRLLNFLQFFIKLKRIASIIKNPVNYVICSSPPPFWIWRCRKLANMKKASLIFEVRDLWPDVVFETSRFGYLNPIAWLMKVAELYAYSSSDKVVCVNPDAIEVISRRGVTCSKFMAIPNGTFIENKSTSLDKNLAIKLQALKDKKAFLIGYSGALSKVYGLNFLVDAVKELESDNVHLIIAGSGALYSLLENKSKQMPNLHMIGWVEKLQLGSLLNMCDICYAGLLNLPSFTYGSDSTKLYEYMKAKKPILHSVGNDNSVVVKANCGIVVNPESSSALINGIQTFRNMDKVTIQQLGQNGYRFVEKERSYDALNIQWKNLFNSL